MEEKFYIETTIKNKVENVWKALTESHYVKEYMFGSHVESNWEINSTILFYIFQDGKRVDIVKGFIQAFEPNKRLKHTLFPIGASYNDDLINHVDVEYKLIPQEDKCLLQITQSGFKNAEDGKKRLESTIKGWQSVLPHLKSIAETIK